MNTYIILKSLMKHCVAKTSFIVHLEVKEFATKSMKILSELRIDLKGKR